jgi:hypothetical protein
MIVKITAKIPSDRAAKRARLDFSLSVMRASSSPCADRPRHAVQSTAPHPPRVPWVEP